MDIESPFEGFKELIQNPLEQSDPRSYDLIRKILTDKASISQPFCFIIEKLTGKNFSNREATAHWRHILENKKALEKSLKRVVGIQTAAVDFFEQQIPVPSVMTISEPVESTAQTKPGEEWIERVYTPGYHLEKLKEEMLRAKRYQHALSAILLDVDEFRKINDALTYKGGDKILTIIVKIIKKTIRTVDIVTRYSGDRFMLILPNTNKREAMELAERLRLNVSDRTKRVEGLPNGATITLSVGQCSKEDSSSEFQKRLLGTLEEGKRQSRNAVYSM